MMTQRRFAPTAARIPRNGCPLSSEYAWMARFCGLVDLVQFRQDGGVLTRVVLFRGHVADTAMAMREVVEGDESGNPGARRLERLEALVREAGKILAGAKQRLDEGVVVAHTGAAERARDPSKVWTVEPLCGLPLSPCSTKR
jgi:hypothetical protein